MGQEVGKLIIEISYALKNTHPFLSGKELLLPEQRY